MIKFLDETRLIDGLDEIFDNSDEFLYVISPYIKLDSWLRRKVKNVRADDFVIVYGKSWMEYKSYDFISSFEDIDLFYHKDLHAKVYINEKAALISSMNLYDYSIENNVECGIWLPRGERAYDYALKFVEGVIDDSKPITM